MSLLKHDLNERLNKYKSKHEPLLKKLSNDCNKDKSMKQKTFTKFKNLNRKETNFEHHKKFGLLKRNTAQDRLKKIRVNLEVKRNIDDQLKKIQYRSEVRHQLPKKYRELLKTSLSDNINFTQHEKNLFQTNYKYSADARLKKIKSAAHKNIPDDDYVKSSSFKRDESTDVLCPISKSKCFEDAAQKVNSQTSDDNLKNIGITSDVPVKTFEENNMKMDIDSEECNVTESKSSLNLGSTPSVSHAYFNSAFTSSDSKNDFKNWKCVNKSDKMFWNQEIYKIRQEPSYLALHENFMSDVVMNLKLPIGDLFIVVDTNIFLSHLSFLEKLLKYKISPHKSHVIVVPWLVIQEIDYAMKKDNSRLSFQAKKANKFIYNCLIQKHPKLFGQSLEDFKENFKNAVCVDDYILQYCIKLITPNNHVILLTNDINLCNKSMVNQLAVFTKTEFEKNFALLDE